MTIRKKAFLSLLLISFLWGSAGAVAKLLLKELDIYVILFYRFGIASVLILPLFLKQEKPKGYLKTLIPFSFLNTLNAIFFYHGLALTTANAAYIINASTPLIISALAWMLMREHVSKEKIAGIFIGLLGSLFIVFLPFIGQGDYIYGNFSGNIFVFLALLAYALYAVGSRKMLRSDTYTPTLTAGMNFFTTTASAGIIAVSRGTPFFTPGAVQPGYLFTLLYASIAMTFITFYLIMWVYKHVSSSTASLKDYLQLIVGFGLNFIILGERVTLFYLVGSLIVIIGVFIATGKQLKQRFITLRKFW